MVQYEIFVTMLLFLVVSLICSAFSASFYHIKSGEIPSYLTALISPINESLFPTHLTLNISLTGVAGILLYSIDKHNNQLMIHFLPGKNPKIAVEFRNEEKTFIISRLCRCVMCKYVPLVISVEVKSSLWIICNGYRSSPMAIGSVTKINDDYPVMKQKLNLTQNYAKLWIINYPKTGKVRHNPLQLQGCIFYVKYNDKYIDLSMHGGAITDKCTTVCTVNSCNGGTCYETYDTDPVCDCTFTFESGPKCSDMGRTINKKFNQQFKFSSIKVSFRRASVPLIWEIGNKAVTLRLEEEDGRLHISKNYTNKDSVTKVIMEAEYSRDQDHIIIFNAGLNEIVQLTSAKVIYKEVSEMNNTMFDYMILSSGTGIIDVAYKVDKSNILWEKWYLSPKTSEDLILVFHGKPNLFLLFIIPVSNLIIIGVILWFRRKKIRLIRKPKERSWLDTKSEIDEQDGLKSLKFHIYHFPELTTIVLNDEITNINDCVTKIKETVISIDRPIFIFQLDGPLQVLPPNLHVIELQYENMTVVEYDEYIIVEGWWNWLQISHMIKRLRIGDCQLGHPVLDKGLFDVFLSRGGKIPIFMDRQCNEDDWADHILFTPSLCAEGTDYSKNTLAENIPGSDKDGSIYRPYMMAPKNARISQIKLVIEIAIRSCQRYIIYITAKKGIFALKRVVSELDRLMMFYLPLLSMCDSKKRILHDNMIVGDTEIAKDGKVIAVAYSRLPVKFAPPLFDTISFRNSVIKAASELVIIGCCITDGPLVVLLRSSHKFGHDVRKRMSYVHPKHPVILADSSGIIPNEAEICRFPDVFHYAVIYKYKEEKVMDITDSSDDRFGSSKCSNSLVGSNSIHRDENMTLLEGKFNERKYGVKGLKGTFTIKRLPTKKGLTINRIVAISARIERHDRVMQYRRLYEDNKWCYVVMDLMKECLSRHISRTRPMIENQIIKLSRQILDGLIHLHSRNVAHGNLKGSNVLLDDGDNVKLSDYGVNAEEDGSESGLLDRIRWTAPERLITNTEMCNLFEADIWSFGATLVEMISGEIPFAGMDLSVVKSKLLNDKVIPCEYPLYTISHLNTCVQSCLNPDPVQRPSCAELFTYDVFK